MPPAPTNTTSVPPTPTNTPVPLAPTNTSVPPTPTNTPVLPTHSPTSTPTPIPTVIGTIDPQQGGEVTSHNGTVQLDFPPGAVGEQASLTVAEQHTPSEETGNLRFGGVAFEILATDGNGNAITHFDEPFTMNVNYSDDDWQNAGIINESMLNIHWWNGNIWVPVLPCDGCSHDTATNEFVLILDHLTEFAMLSSEQIPTAITLKQAQGESPIRRSWLIAFLLVASLCIAITWRIGKARGTLDVSRT